MIKIKRFEGHQLKTYEFKTYEEARVWEEKQLEEFKKINRVRDELKDKAFIAFRNEIGRVIDHRCPECAIEDHEQEFFCRCEGRNIQIAKRQRERAQLAVIKKRIYRWAKSYSR